MQSRRRVLLALGALALPRAAIAQKVHRIGFLGPERLTDAHQALRLDLLRAGLRERGYSEGTNIVIEMRFADGAYERLPALAAELVAHKVSVMVALGSKAALAAHGATKTIPIVVASVGDAVALGLSTNLGRPSSNVTGWVNVGPELSVKLLGYIKDTAPRVTHVAYLVNPATPPTHMPEIRSTATSHKIRLTVFEARTARDLEPVFGQIAASQCDAILVQGDTLFSVDARAVTDLALRHRLVSASSLTSFADAGGLVFYGPDRLEGYRRAAYFVDRLLKGAKPGDLPMEQPTKFELVINLKTAKALGLTIPQSVLAHADEVIQ